LQTDGGFSDITELPPVHSEVLEDEEPIRAWLRASPGGVGVSIASGGDNVFHLALDGLGKIYGVDISPAQIALCRLKSTALMAFSESEIASLMGIYGPATEGCAALLGKVLEATGLGFASEGALAFAEANGLLRIGAFEQMVAAVREQIHEAVGEDTVRLLIAEPDPGRRRGLWEQHSVTDGLTPIFRTFFDEEVLAGIFTPKRFQPILACSPFADHLLRVVTSLVLDGDPGQNYYLHRWALGGYLPAGPVPPYLDPANLPALREAMPRIEWVVSELAGFLAQLPTGEVNCFNLSNVLDWCDDEYACLTWQEITRVAAPGARLFARTFLYDRPHQEHAQKLGWFRDPAAEGSCLAKERVGYYPGYELWSRASD
jgi:S-adenosylmethionine-diacylglycerol 3-amino-3-carboxypropyl transferase